MMCCDVLQGSASPEFLLWERLRVAVDRRHGKTSFGSMMRWFGYGDIETAQHCAQSGNVLQAAGYLVL